MNKFDITLCLIVKNEEDYVAKCIESVQPIVKKIIIGDTGSKDNTISICNKYVDVVEKIDFSYGFSHARNTLLQKVNTTWVLFLDADEYFDLNELKKLSLILPNISDEVDALSLLRYNFFSNGAFYTSESIKIFRAHPDIYYTGIVVDSIKPSLLKKGKKIEQISIVLNHFGHCRPIELRNKKSLKYLSMMDKELLQNPENFKVMGYKALIFRTLGELKKARFWAKKAFKIAPNEGHPHFVNGHVFRAAGKHNQAIKSYSKAIELEGMNPLYLNSRGVAYLTNGDFKKAKEDFILGSKLFPNYVHFTINCALVDEALGNYSQAYNRLEDIGRKYPSFLESSFGGSTEIDPYSGYIYDTIFNFKGLGYHLAYCYAKKIGLL